MKPIGKKEMIKICTLYYREGKTQEEISTLFGFSRFKISRLLKEARSSGLVTIKINDPMGETIELEVKLAKRFDLKQAVVTRTNDLSEMMGLDRIGEAGAHYLAGILNRTKILGVAWGRSVYHIVKNVQPLEISDITVVQIAGGMRAIEGTDANALTMILGQKLKGRAHGLPAPVIVRDREIRDTLLREKEIREALSIARKADAALFGIGLPGEGGVLYSAGFIDKKTARELKKAGAVGAVCGHFFDINGQSCPNDLDDRIIGMDLGELKRIKHKIGIAVSRQKIRAILGALRGGLLDVLVTDEETAVGLLEKS